MMSLRPIRFGLRVLAVAVLVVVAWQLDSWESLTRFWGQLTDAEESQSTDSLSLLPNDLLWSFRGGIEMTYGIRYRSHGEVSIQDDNRQRPVPYALTFTGSLVVETLGHWDKSSSGVMLMRMSVREARGSARLQGHPRELADLGPLEAHFALAPDGRVGWFEASTGSSPVGRNLLRSLVFAWVFETPQPDSQRPFDKGAQWRRGGETPFGVLQEQTHLSGTFARLSEALHASGLSDSDGGMIDENQRRYIHLRTKLSGGDTGIGPTGLVRRVLAVSPVQPVAVGMVLDTHQQQGTVLTANHVEMNLWLQATTQLIRSGVVSASLPPASAWSERALVAETGNLSDLDAHQHREVLGERRMADVLDGLAEWDQKRRDGPVNQLEVTEVYLRLKAAIALYPEDLTDLLDVLQSASADSLSLQLGVGALAAVASPGAQEVLVSLARSRVEDTKLAKRLLPMLVLEGYPSLETEDFLLRLSRTDERVDVRHGAQLALGIMARRVANEDPARAQALVEQAGEQLSEAVNNVEKKHWLGVLGNSGLPLTVDIVTPFLQSDDSAIRGEAAYSLRFVDTVEAERLLQIAVDDPDAKVRQRAAHAIVWRKPSARLTEWQIRKFGSVEDEFVKLQFLKNLWNARTISDAIEPFVARVAETERAERVRRFAQGLREGRF